MGRIQKGERRLIAAEQNQLFSKRSTADLKKKDVNHQVELLLVHVHNCKR